MIERKIPTHQEQAKFMEKLYKIYDAKNRADYEGSIAKYECTIDGERGLFKERQSMQSKDHIMEQFVYDLACILNVRCCKNSCRKVGELYGSFSRFEVQDLENVIPLARICNAKDMFSDELLNFFISKFRGPNAFIIRLYQYIIFDFITGQLDRHLENLSLYRYNGKFFLYPLYDNGFCCFSTYGNDNAITMLNNGFYQSRMGSDLDIIKDIHDYRPLIYPGDLRNLIPYHKINKEVLRKLLHKADKYRQLTTERTEATVNFIYKQISDIHRVNMGEDIK